MTLDEHIRALVREELARALGSSPLATVYSTAPGGILPTGRSRRWLREHASAMGGARTGGARGRGVVWTVTHEQYTTWLARSTSSVVAKPVAPVVDIDAWISGAGMRLTRNAG